MIILDTNVVSEPMKPHGSTKVIDWLDRQAAETMYLTAINLSELLLGEELLSAGRRREGLTSALRGLVDRLFGTRVLPFDQEAASVYASLVARARAAGHSLSVADGQIAAIALLHGYAVATRDRAPFLAAGVRVLDPWE